MFDQKGFARIILLLIVIIFMAGGLGVFYLKWHLTRQIPDPALTKSPSSNDSNKSILKSKFFATDADANELVKQNLSRDIRAFTDDSNLISKNATNSANIFEYKVTSALRMLGMTRPSNLSGNIYLGEILLNKFQKLHNLEQSPYISAEILKKIDGELAIQERKDEKLAHQFPLYDRFTQSPPNQLTKDHVAALYTLAFQSLPPDLVHWNAAWFEGYLKSQYNATLFNRSSVDWQICTGAQLLYGLADACSQPDGEVITIWDELTLLGTLIHEYGHFIDKNAWPDNDIAIDTTGFYQISFKGFDPKSYPSSTDLDKYYQRNVSSNRDEFLTGYAKANNFKEDFAESFTMYVMQGNIFRELAKKNEFINQKYEWLKQNIFHGVQYNTGVYHPNISYSDMGHVEDYSLIDPDFHFTYELPKL